MAGRASRRPTVVPSPYEDGSGAGGEGSALYGRRLRRSPAQRDRDMYGTVTSAIGQQVLRLSMSMFRFAFSILFKCLSVVVSSPIFFLFTNFVWRIAAGDG